MPAVRIIVALLFACGAVSAAERPVVFVSIPPQRWLVRQIAADRVDVQALITPGQNPHTFEPTPRQMAGLARASAYLAIGLPFEQRMLPKLRGARPDLACIRVDAGLARVADDHGHDAAHTSEEAGDPHVWLAPSNMCVLATNSFRALCRIDPAGADGYARNLAALEQRIAALDEELRGQLAPLRGGVLFVYHPSWGYFAREFGLRQVAIENEGRSPSARQLAQLTELARREAVRTVFVDPQFDPRPARIIAAQIGAEVVALDPLAEAWDENLRLVATHLRRMLATKEPHAGQPASH